MRTKDNEADYARMELLFLEIMEIELRMELGRMTETLTDREYIDATILQTSKKSELDILARKVGVLN